MSDSKTQQQATPGHHTPAHDCFTGMEPLILPSVLNPLIRGSLPDPSAISDIAPNLQAFKRGSLGVSIAYDPDNQDSALQILEQRDFLKAKRLVFIVHGFQNDNDEPWMHKMKDAILEEADDTVILVGWGKGAKMSLVYYRYAAGNTQAVGEWLGKLAAGVSKQVENIWGIGHSLGAHVLGKAGRASGAFKRITGLDPAGPLFEKFNKEMRLSSTDAPFVDAIHTDGDADGWKLIHLGTLLPLGTVNFYPNYGLTPNWEAMRGDAACGHSLAVKLFTKSISHPDIFKTNQILAEAPEYEEIAKDTVDGPMAQMGYYADQHAKMGNYYLPAEKE